ncbi:hypothetical protein HMPREF0682_0440, partial [Propionibacterium acidifaciens F0233]
MRAPDPFARPRPGDALRAPNLAERTHPAGALLTGERRVILLLGRLGRGAGRAGRTR